MPGYKTYIAIFLLLALFGYAAYKKDQKCTAHMEQSCHYTLKPNN